MSIFDARYDTPPPRKERKRPQGSGIFGRPSSDWEAMYRGEMETEARRYSGPTVFPLHVRAGTDQEKRKIHEEAERRALGVLDGPTTVTEVQERARMGYDNARDALSRLERSGKVRRVKKKGVKAPLYERAE